MFRLGGFWGAVNYWSLRPKGLKAERWHYRFGTASCSNEEALEATSSRRSQEQTRIFSTCLQSRYNNTYVPKLSCTRNSIQWHAMSGGQAGQQNATLSGRKSPDRVGSKVLGSI